MNVKATNLNNAETIAIMMTLEMALIATRIFNIYIDIFCFDLVLTILAFLNALKRGEGYHKEEGLSL